MPLALAGPPAGPEVRAASAAPPLPRRFGQRGTQRGDTLGGENQRRQVGLREVAVVVRLFLAAQGAGGAALGVEAAGVLGDADSALEKLDVARDLVLDGTGHVAEGVEVLDLALGAEACLAAAAHRDVGVAAQAALFHVAVAGFGIEQHLVEGLQVVLGFGGAGHVGLRNDLDQRHAAAVEVHQALARQGLTAGRLVQELAGVLLEMEPLDPHALRVMGERQQSALGKRTVVLADLVALRQVGVEVVLAREDRGGMDLAAQRRGERDGQVDGMAVDHRQGARVSQAHRADQGVRLGPEPVGAPAEHLALRQQLDMDLQPDDRLIVRHLAAKSISARRRRRGRGRGSGAPDEGVVSAGPLPISPVTVEVFVAAGAEGNGLDLVDACGLELVTHRRLEIEVGTAGWTWYRTT